MRIFKIKIARNITEFKNIDVDFQKATTLILVVNNISESILTIDDKKFYIIEKLHKIKHSKLKVDLLEIDLKVYLRDKKIEKMFF